MRIFLFVVLIIIHSGFSLATIKKAKKSLSDYRKELTNFRDEFGGTKEMPDVHFFLFGMGNRTKLIYKDGRLINALNGEIIESWDYTGEVIVPNDYSVYLELKNGRHVTISEDEAAVWINGENFNRSVPGTNHIIKLPDFRNYRYGLIMKVLHHEILINILESKPLPNFLVYKKPWRRDGAMMAMCLKTTGNIDLIKEWVLSLDDPFDRNNAGETEADNLGQTLFILSYFTDGQFPLVSRIQDEAKKFEVKGASGKYIKGLTDSHETPVYQTKWLKYGLKALNLRDDYSIPDITDDYSALFWWDYKDSYAEGTTDAADKGYYPYLGWACDHFHNTRTSPISNRDYPLTWEINASQADYYGMNIIDVKYSVLKNASPHTWHASEIFLYLLEFRK